MGPVDNSTAETVAALHAANAGSILFTTYGPGETQLTNRSITKALKNEGSNP